ncbi:Mor transcription activator family protein [Alkalilimnicola sp. S0819]|uniref:Mor transcription activator family protein n=1 Tax=Alkalilimnicola sp. S0819 TaxID=2613922 RepID=UPI00126168AE|nr:Mor transcription activator family protein [Alkalilimnicola sp. S0819]KAB7624341.1 hypothetical protein F3N43_05905 [Alkalilimnicola sp. S0819]MPQ16166.1 hypothetical protein [Alkalilimnicola sp. S0819]
MSDEQTLHYYDEDLPPVLAEIRDLVGTEPTLALVAHYGGTHVPVPKRFDPGHPLARVLGPEAAVHFIGRFGGTRPYIAKLELAVRALRNIEISRRYEGGSTVARLAREYHLSERQIWNILKRPETLRDAPDQADLFG